MITATIPGGRYSELVKALPKGEYYACDGDILPFATDPYPMSFAGTAPNQLHYVALNGYRIIDEIITDSNGNISINVQFALGENIIEVVNRHDNSKHTSYITTRHWATWMAGVADVITTLDANIQTLYDNLYLNTVNADKIDEVWGRRLQSVNIAAYELNTYRDILINIHQAYRRFGGKLAGLQGVVSALTQVNPLMLPVGFGAEWRLGVDFLENNYFQFTDPTDPWGWTVTPGATLSSTTGHFKPTTLAVSGSGSWSLYARVKRGILQYKGFQVTYGVWAGRKAGAPAPAIASVKLQVSFDGGTTWTVSSSASIATNLTGSVHVKDTAMIPLTATDVIVKVVGSSAGAMNIRLDRAFIGVDVHTSSALGVNTVARNRHQQMRGYKCFVWCRDRLTWGEKQQIGITLDGTGHIHNIIPTHIAIKVYNIAKQYSLPLELPAPLT